MNLDSLKGRQFYRFKGIGKPEPLKNSLIFALSPYVFSAGAPLNDFRPRLNFLPQSKFLATITTPYCCICNSENEHCVLYFNLSLR